MPKCDTVICSCNRKCLSAKMLLAKAKSCNHGLLEKGVPVEFETELHLHRHEVTVFVKVEVIKIFL